MCGIMFTAGSGFEFAVMMGRLKHRGTVPGARDTGLGHLGTIRLPIVGGVDGMQPTHDGRYSLAFNGELYNYEELGQRIAESRQGAIPKLTEVRVIEEILRHYPKHAHRFFDGYYALIWVDDARREVMVMRDFPGVMPLYYQTHPIFAIASEKKALENAHEVMPGETIVWRKMHNGTFSERHRSQFDPVSLHQQKPDILHLAGLFREAVKRRVLHSNVRPICVALSGGLDSSLVLAAIPKSMRPHVVAITAGFDINAPEVSAAQTMARLCDVKWKFVQLSEQEIMQDKHHILWHLEDYTPNKIKYSAMICNYYVASNAPGVVILCGEGADELEGGYQSHEGTFGLNHEYKTFSTLRSMHAINLDRVNKGGMAWTKEYRTPFLDRAVMLYCMACYKPRNKQLFRDVAEILGVPDAIIQNPKFGSEVSRLWSIVEKWT